MLVKRLGWCVVWAAVSPVFGQWESGSDGSDGAFSPAVSTQVDLSLAASLCDCDGGGTLNDPCRWDCPSPVAGRGVYDAEQWVVVYKYTTIDVAAGATITFNMHPSGAPVVWLATGNATISGTVNLDGEDGLVSSNPPIIPYYTRPGPGGFQGGQAFHAGTPAIFSRGLGPGSSPTNRSLYIPKYGGSASHATSADDCGGVSSGANYGNSGALPLIGGSGGNQSEDPAGAAGAGGGGAGGGGILVATDSQIIVGGTGVITVEGGTEGGVSGTPGGAGSGGAIRLRAATVSLASGSVLEGRGGRMDCANTRAGAGRIRIEAGTVTNLGTINGSQSFPGAPSPVFAATPPPQLYVTAVCGQSAPADPEWGIYSTDVDVNSASACTVNITGSGMPVGTIVVVRAIPARGSIISVNSTPMVDAGGGLRTATASVTFPAGRSELQLRANW